MHLGGPWNLLWAIPLSGLIVLMYILKLRRRDLLVSSTFLWSQVIRDVQANSPFQKLRKNLLLLLQLIVAALVVIALAKPFFKATALGGRNIVIVVDTSASMSATDVAPSRLELAKTKAHDIVRGMRPGDQIMVLSAHSRPEAMTGFTNQSPELHRAIDALTGHITPNNMRDALNLSADLVAARNSGSSGRIELISDGGFAAGSDKSGETSLTGLNLGLTHLAYTPVGKSHDNLGIVAVDFRRNLGSDKTVQLLVVTHNYSDQPKNNQDRDWDISLKLVKGCGNHSEMHTVGIAESRLDLNEYSSSNARHSSCSKVPLTFRFINGESERAATSSPKDTLQFL